MATQTAISLAILQVNWDERKQDYLDNFVPIIAECVRLQKSEVISTGVLKTELESRFGLNIPASAINTILRRLRRKHYVFSKDRIYYRNIDKLSSLNFHRVQQEVVHMHDSLITNMIGYCKKVFGLDWSPEEAGNNLLSFLRENDLQIMSAITSGTLIPDTILLTKAAKYYCAHYLKHIEDTKSAELEYVGKIVEGNMLANAIFLPDPMRATRKFHKTQIFFDTSFLIYALGYAGKPREEPCTELLQLLYETGAELYCFQHTVNEMIGILESCSMRIRNREQADAYGTMEYFIEQNYSESDIHVLINNIRNSLSSIRVNITDKPPYEPKYVIDEEALGRALEEEINYRSSQARDRDVDSISAIMRFRHMEEFYFIEDCKALFITTNTAVARVSRIFFSNSKNDASISPCITDYSLTNLLWLKKPLKMPDLPMKRVIADCYAALQPDERLIRAYLSKIEVLGRNTEITEDEVFMLRHSLEARQALMDVTSGGEEVLTNINIKEILEIIKERFQSKMRADIEEKAQHQIEKATIERDEYKSLAETQSESRQQAEAKIEELETLEITRNANINSRTHKISHYTAWSIGFVFILILILGFVLLLPWNFPALTESSLRYVSAISIFAVVIYAICNLITGVHIASIVRNIELKLERPIRKIITKLTS